MGRQMREVVDMKNSFLLYVNKKTAFVLKKRFFFRRRIRISEFIDLFSDNFWKPLPEKKRKRAYRFLNRLVDRIIRM